VTLGPIPFAPPPPVAIADADRTGCPVCGRDACVDHLLSPPNGSHGTQAQRPRSRLTVHRACDLISEQRPAEIIEGIAYADCITVIAAESGTGKTFVTLDMAAAVSDGVPWHRREVRQGSVIYLAYEGDAYGLRLRALREFARRRLEHLYVIRAHDPISPRVTREGEDRALGEIVLIDTIEEFRAELETEKRPAIALAVIDTARQSMTGSEDSSESVSAYLRATRRVMAAMPGAAMILVHHTGWQDGEEKRRRERGSSAWRGNCDATIYLEAGDYDAEKHTCPLTLKVLKMRDEERPAPLRLRRRRVEFAEALGRNPGRGPVTSCIIESDPRSEEDEKAEQQRAVDEIDLRVLRVIADNPELSTSQSSIRAAAGLQRDTAYEALARLTQRTWIMPPVRQRLPYTVTGPGLRALGRVAES